MHLWQIDTETPHVQCTETRLALLWRIWTSRPPFHQMDVSAKERCTASLTALFEKLGAATEHAVNAGDATKHAGDAWAHEAEATLRSLGLGVAPVDARQVFHHTPGKKMGVEKQKQALMKTGVYYALDICWEPSCYSRNPGKSWWVPREWFKRVSPLAAAVPDSEAIPCSTLWDEAWYSRTADPWRKFFITTADFEEYNHTRMAAADPQAHRWCSTKLLFDFTPYVMDA